MEDYEEAKYKPQAMDKDVLYCSTLGLFEQKWVAVARPRQQANLGLSKNNQNKWSLWWQGHSIREEGQCGSGPSEETSCYLKREVLGCS